MRVEAYNPRHYNCIDYLLDGSLYGGQPICVQPPMIYVVGAFLSLFGMENIEPLSNLVLILLHATSLYIILHLVERRGKGITATVAILYCLIIVPLSLNVGFYADENYDKNQTGNLPEMFAACLMLAATYALSKTKHKRKIVLASVFLALALTFKVTVLSGIAAIFIVYAINPADLMQYTKGRLKFNRKQVIHSIKNAVVFLTPMVIVILLLRIIYPNILVYAVLCHTYKEKLGYFDAVRGIISTNPLADGNLLLFYILTIAVGAYYVRFKDRYALIYLIASATTFISRFKVFGFSPDMLGGLFDRGLFARYIVFPLFFLLIVVGNYLSNVPDAVKRKRLIAILVMSALFFGGYHLYEQPTLQELVFMQTGVYRDLKGLKHEIEGVYALLPRNNDWVLTDNSMHEILEKHGTTLDANRIDVRDYPPRDIRDTYRYIDPWFLEGLQHYGIVRETPQAITEKELSKAKELAIDIEKGGYEMVFFGPAEIGRAHV